MFGNGCPVLERRLAKRVRGLQSCAVDYQGSSIPDITPAEMSMSKRQWEKSLQKRRHQLKDGLDNRAPTPPPPATPPANYEGLRPSNSLNFRAMDACPQTDGKDNSVPAQYLLTKTLR